MQFEAGNVYRHKNFKDVKVFVKTVVNTVWHDNAFHMEVIWLTNSGTAMAVDKIKVYLTDLEKWSRVDGDA